MWPLPVSTRTLLIAGVVLSVIAASLWLGYRLGRSDGDRDVRKMLEAGQRVVQKRDLQINSLREQSLEDADRIADLSRGVRVRCKADRPADRLPTSPDAGATGDDRATGEDFGPVLRQCLRSFGEINRALK